MHQLHLAVGASSETLPILRFALRTIHGAPSLLLYLELPIGPARGRNLPAAPTTSLSLQIYLQLYLDKYGTCMLTFLVIIGHHGCRTRKSCPTSALPHPCSLFSLQSKLPTRSAPSTFNFQLLTSLPSSFKPTSLPIYLLASPMRESQVTKSPVTHPLSIQQLTKCSSRNSFVLKMIHFDGGVPVVAQPITTAIPSSRILIPYPLSFHILAHSFALFCVGAKLNSFVFRRFRTLSQNTGGGTGAFHKGRASRRAARFWADLSDLLQARRAAGPKFCFVQETLCGLPASFLPSPPYTS
jgi:hypothetical protein